MGDVPAEQRVDALATYYAGEPTLNVLLDFTEAKLGMLSTSDVRHLAKLTPQYADGRAGGKTALLFGSLFGYGLGRMFEQLRHASGAQVAYRAFRERERAMERQGGVRPSLATAVAQLGEQSPGRTARCSLSPERERFFTQILRCGPGESRG